MNSLVECRDKDSLPHAVEFGLPESAELIDCYGADSDVWRVGNQVIKVYPYTMLNKLMDYQTVTHLGKVFLKHKPSITVVSAGDISYKCHMRINPINCVTTNTVPDAMFILPKHYNVTKSLFIAGPQAEDLRLDAEVFGGALCKLDPEEQRRLLEFYQKCGGSDTLGVLDTEFSKMSDILNPGLKASGINIIPLNVKLRSPARGIIDCIVTDLCKDLRSFSWIDGIVN